MNKFSLAVLLTLFPILAAADDSLSFTPPPTDYSVVFLGNIFGIVDGILHGTGSQIMGSMFAVFNAAVLALGGMVIMYTLIVSTMNTAHEGQMLGQKWSSIWIPVRSTVGLALLIPKASGYCLMQIFVMWIVVQGVGAADKVWDAALSYLNRGGVIIQGQMDPTKALLASGSSGVAGGAQAILEGQVCMLALQNQLQSQLESYKKQVSSKAGPCSGTPSADMKKFCDSTVPNFNSTVDAVSTQKNAPLAQTSFSAQMPDFEDTSIYHQLNGVCGEIKWDRLPTGKMDAVSANITSLSASDLDTAKMSRAIAIQQMFMDLGSVAQTMVQNDPGLAGNNTNTSTNADGTTNNYAIMAIQQFGVPFTLEGKVCDDITTPDCNMWQAESTSGGAPLFNGTEFQGAIADYNGIMLPTLNLMNQAQNAQSANESRKFIQKATTEGWIMAGSYFFDLVNLNSQSGSATGGPTDTDTGLDSSTSDVSVLVKSFGTSSLNPVCSGHYAVLCTWFDQNVAMVSPIATLIKGTGAEFPEVNSVTFSDNNLSNQSQNPVIKGKGSSTVNGYIRNAMILHLPGQPGTKPLTFANMVHISVDTQVYQLPEASFPCGNLKIMFWATCLGSMFGELFYNIIIRNIYNFLLVLGQDVINQTIMAFMIVPLQGMASIFDYGLNLITAPGVNPIVGLAQMGTYYINFVANLWLQIIEQSILSVLVPIIGLFIFVMIGLSLPLLMAWLGIMLSIGFSTAYYVPILPYMIFTFGTIAWLMAVIEAMVAAPIVALGVTHPEGHDAFGKGEQAIMILLNVFLRPSMMIIGYIAAIAVAYVSVWIINAGFDNAIGFMQGSKEFGTHGYQVSTNGGSISGGYVGWAGIYAYFFSILIYTTLYITVVQKAFTLISVLPDKVLRWIGGQPESYGSDSAQWGEETKGKIAEAGKETAAGQQQMDKAQAGKLSEALGKLKGAGGGEASASGAT